MGVSHEHEFEPANLVRTSFGVTAWVPNRAMGFTYSSGRPDPTPGAYLCSCGEQGYAVPA